MKKTRKATNSSEQLISLSSELAGAAIAGALGFLSGSPAIAAGAGIVGVTIAKSANILLTDIANRQLSRREEIKVGAAAAFALDKIQKRLESGEQPRDDYFFSKDSTNHSDAEEILEGVLQKSKNEHEEKKIRLLGNFYATLVFSKGISIGEANYLLQLVESLTYRQICVLAILLVKPEFSEVINLRTTSYAKTEELPFETYSLLQEILDMISRGLIRLNSANNKTFISNPNINLLIPNQLVLTAMGERLISTLSVTDIITDKNNKFPEDFQVILEHLSQKKDA
ncbi:MAG: hypothetical protein U0Z26_07820 [Anaerolineales bacterium]